MRHTPNMPARLYLETPLSEGAGLTLPPEPARHAQVLRLQPGDTVVLFNGDGGEWPAEITRMGGRLDVAVRVGVRQPVSRELATQVSLALGMPANERMDSLVEKATELGVAAIQPLHSARSVLRLAGERAEKRRAHWQAVAVSAAEQSGRTQVPRIAPIRELETWLAGLDADPATARHVLSLDPASAPLRGAAGSRAMWLLSGPEGGLEPREEALARARGFTPMSLGPRVLRADTAPLAALAVIAAQEASA